MEIRMNKFKTYTYYLYHIPTAKKYYGYRFANKCEAEQDLWSTYFSSSELVKELIKEYGKESFRAEVRKLFDTREEAHEYEQRFLHKVKAVESKEWLNRAYANSSFYSVQFGNKNAAGCDRPFAWRQQVAETMKGKQNSLGCKHTKEQNEASSLRMCGDLNPNFEKPMAETQKAQISESLRGNTNALGHRLSEETKAIIGLAGIGRIAWNVGVPQAEDAKQKNREKHIGLIWICNVLEGKESRIMPPLAIPDGYTKGRLFHKRKEDCVNHCSKSVQTPLGIFKSIKHASLAHNCHRAVIIRRCSTTPSEYFFINKVLCSITHLP